MEDYLMRLDKFLSNMGYGTRTEIKKHIGRGSVKVNEIVVKKVGFNINPDTDVVTFNGSEVLYSQHVYIMMNKPQGVITATEDKEHKTVVDLIKSSYGNRKIFPVGRLDKDTEGMLLLTDDGHFNHELMSPKKHVAKQYYAKIMGEVSKKDIVSFQEGLIIDNDELCKPGLLEILKVDLGQSEILLTITEGKYHQVKRMFKSLGMKVLYLKRVRIGGLVLDDQLALGEYRELTIEEIKKIKP